MFYLLFSFMWSHEACQKNMIIPFPNNETSDQSVHLKNHITVLIIYYLTSRLMINYIFK